MFNVFSVSVVAFSGIRACEDFLLSHQLLYAKSSYFLSSVFRHEPDSAVKACVSNLQLKCFSVLLDSYTEKELTNMETFH